MAISKLTSPVTQNDAINKINEIIGETDYETDSEPYLLRAAPYGGVEVDEIIGGTVAWNQLVQNGNFVNTSGWTAVTGTFSVSSNVATYKATAQWGSLVQTLSNELISSHKYLTFVDIYGTTDIYVNNGLASKYLSSNDTWQTVILFANALSTRTYSIRVGDKRASGWTNVLIKNFNMFDLTQMFGSTIADYIYAQEQATAGAGVAIFRKLFPASYYAYNAGELISVSGLSAHEMVGRNLLPRMVPGTYTLNGVTATVDGNNKLTFSGTGTASGSLIIPLNGVYEYHGGKICFHMRNSAVNSTLAPNFESSSGTSLIAPALSTINRLYDFNDSNKIGYKVERIRFWITNGLTPSGTFQPSIELGSTATDYEPYQKHSYPLDSSLTLRGIPKLSNGKMYFDGDIYASDGTVTRRYAVVDMGSLTWSQPRTSEFRAMISTIVPTPQIAERSNVKGNIICSKYPTVTADETYQQYRGVAISANQATGYVSVYDSTYTDAATFKTAMSGVYLVYELATPTTETADPFTNPQIVSEYGTEEYVDERDVPIPVGHNTKYISGYGLTQQEAIITSLIGSSPITSYDAGTEALLTAGTDTSNRVWQAKILHDYVTDAVAEAGGASPSTSVPLMDGTGAVGTSNLYARGDHVHPSDTTKADKASTVTNVAWDTTNHKLTKTINGTTSDISILPGLLNRGTITAFNDATTTGLYTYSSSATNRPPVSAGGACLVLYISSSSCWQLAFITSTSSTAMQAYARRMYSSGNWTAWKAFTFAS